MSEINKPTAPSGYFTLSPDCEIIEINFAGAKMPGKESCEVTLAMKGNLQEYFHIEASSAYQWTSEEAIGKNIIELLAAEEIKPIIQQNFEKLLKMHYLKPKRNINCWLKIFQILFMN